MKTLYNENEIILDGYGQDAFKATSNDQGLLRFSREDMISVFEKLKIFFQDSRILDLHDLIYKDTKQSGKNSFLVYKHNKYITVPRENIAFFYVRNESVMLSCYDGREYSVNYSLEQIHQLVSQNQFFRLNRQHLINFSAVKEVEHYFGRKLFVRLSVPTTEKLLVSKERSGQFLAWLENR